MEESLKQLIRCTRDAVCAQGNKLVDEAKLSLRQTGDKVTALVGYVGIDEDKLHRLAVRTAFYRDIIERECSSYLQHVDVAAANVLLNTLTKQLLREHDIKYDLCFETKLKHTSNGTLDDFNTRKKYLNTESDNEGRKQSLISDIIWYGMRQDPTLDGIDKPVDKNKSRRDDEKIRCWNKRIDEVDIVRKCGTKQHLLPKADDKHTHEQDTFDYQKASRDQFNETEEMHGESYIIEKLKKKCEELKRLLNSKTTRACALKKNADGDSVADMIDNSAEEPTNQLGPEEAKYAKERLNQTQARTEKSQTDLGDVDDVNGCGETTEALTLNIPANVHRIILIKNGCRIAVEV